MHTSDELIDQLETTPQSVQKLKGSGGALATGILSLVFFSGIIGIILAIATLSSTKRLLREYNANPAAYTLSSYKQANAGRICAIISLSLLGLLLLILVGAGMLAS